MSTKRAFWVMLTVGILVGAGFAARLLSEFDWNPTTQIKFGSTNKSQLNYAESLLGDVVVADLEGHDGKFFFIQAMDPFYLHPDQHAHLLDRPSYRAQRMLYPALASLGGFASPIVTAWGLIVVNVLFIGIGTAFTSLIAREMGLSYLFGLAFLLNPGVIVDLNIDASGVVALALLMAGIYFVVKERDGPAVVALTMSCLARETMILSVIGLAGFLWWKRRRVPWLFGIPFFFVAGWWVFVHQRLAEGLGQDTEALGPPLAGFIGALRIWISIDGHVIDLVFGFMLLLMSFLLSIRTLRRPTPLGAAVAPFALLALLISTPVWLRYFDSARAIAPVLTAYVLLVPASRVKDKPTNEPAPGELVSP